MVSFVSKKGETWYKGTSDGNTYLSRTQRAIELVESGELTDVKVSPAKKPGEYFVDLKNGVGQLLATNGGRRDTSVTEAHKIEPKSTKGKKEVVEILSNIVKELGVLISDLKQ